MAKKRRVSAGVNAQATTSNGVLINDPARLEKTAEQWSDEELKAWGLYEINGTKAASDDQLAEEARKRLGLPSAWSVDNIRQSFEGTQPPKTSNGVWVTDITRDQKTLSEWTKEELYALYNKEIKSRYVTTGDAWQNAVRELAKADHPTAGDWVLPELMHWLSTGTPAAVTRRGSLLESRTRPTRPTEEWTDEELLDLVEGLIRMPSGRENSLREEIVERFDLYEGLVYDDIRLVLIDDKPARTASNGVYVYDLLRNITPPADWTEEQLEGWAQEWINYPAALDEGLATVYKKRKALPERWNSQEVHDYVKTGKEPVKLADELTDEELKAWIKGDLSYQAGTSVQALIDEVRQRAGEVPDAWTDQQVMTYFVSGEKPPKTSTGLWVVDVTRDRKDIDDWNLAELRTWGLGEINPPKGYTDESFAEWLRTHISDVDYAWDLEAVKAYYAYGTEPAYDPLYGLFLEDRTRATRPVDTWPENELRAVVAGIVTVDEALYAKVVERVREIVAPPSNWLVGDVLKAYLDRSYRPPEARNGVLINDPSREAKPLTAWTADELQAAANEEIGFPFSKRDLASTIRKHRPYPKEVSDVEVIHLFAQDEDAHYTSSGLLVEDSVRQAKLAPQWTTEELQGFIEGELPATHLAPAEALCNVAQQRIGFPVEWTCEEAIAYYRDGIEPPKTPGGVWVNARKRDLTGTTTKDLQVLAAWAKNEISLSGEVIQGIRPNVVKTFGLEGLNEVQLIEFFWNLKPEDIKEDHFNRDVLLRYTPAQKWLPEELVRYLEGKLKATEYVTDDALKAQARKVFQIPEEVKDTELADYMVRKNVLGLTSNGILILDPEREFKPANQWSRAELMAYALGEISATKGVTQKTLRAALKANFDGIEDAWSMEQVCAYVAKGVIPPKTSTGVWVVDVLRSEKHIAEWTADELTALARKEITAPKGASPEQVLRTLRIRFNVPDRWNDAQVMVYVASGEEPSESASIKVQDPLRDRKVASEWTDAELSAWLKGKIASSLKASDEALMLYARKRFKYPDAWTNDQVYAHARTGEQPPRTSNGLWVLDQVRNAKEAREWSLPELQAWALGEIRTGPKVSGKALLDAARTYLLTRIDTAAEHWGDQEIHLWLRTGSKPTLTASGLYKNDPLRELKIAREWSREELIAYLKGEVSTTRRAGAQDLYLAVLEKWAVPAGWYEQDVRDYVLFDRVPPKTSNGLWVRDQVRDCKIAYHWVLAELKAWARGEISASRYASDQNLLNEIRNRFNLSPLLSAAKIKQLIADLREESDSMAIDFIKQNLDGYAKNMALNKKSTEVEWAGQQTLLYTTIQRVLKLKEREFVDGWTALLDFVNQNLNTLFAPKNAFRGYAQMNLSKRDRDNFEQLLNLLIRTASPETRYAEAQSTNFKMALKQITNETVRQQILSYYNVG